MKWRTFLVFMGVAGFGGIDQTNGIKLLLLLIVCVVIRQILRVRREQRNENRFGKDGYWFENDCCCRG